MLKLTGGQLGWRCERIPDAPVSPGQPQGRAARDGQTGRDGGIFWILDNGAKGKGLPRRFGSKSAVHRWFSTWVKVGVVEAIMREDGRVVEERGSSKLYECSRATCAIGFCLAWCAGRRRPGHADTYRDAAEDDRGG